MEVNEYGDDDWATPVRENNEMNQQEIETKLKETFSPIHIDLVDKSHTHTADEHIETMKDKERFYELTIVADSFKSMTIVDRHKAIYKVLDIMNNPGIHGIKIKASSPEEWKK
jgi:BolA protein